MFRYIPPSPPKKCVAKPKLFASMRELVIRNLKLHVISSLSYFAVGISAGLMA